MSILLSFVVFGAVVCIAVATAAASCGLSDYHASEGLGTTNPSQEDIRHCFKADPINCATGNLTETHADLAVQGHGPSLQLVRYYNSQVAWAQSSAGSFGYGWSSSYSARLIFNAEKTVATVVHDNGSTLQFTLSGGVWTAPSWTQSTLVKFGESYLYKQPDHTMLEFNAAGRLLTISDRHGLSLGLTYGTSGRLERVEDEAGRKLTFAYNSGGQVEKVTDPMGRIAKYSYTSGNLTSVTLPGSETPRWKFGYNSAHELTSLTNGRGFVTTTTYDTSHRATTQTDPLNRKYTFTYKETNGIAETTITEPNGTTTLEKFNEAGSPTSITHGVGTSLEAETKYTYGLGFWLLSATDPLGHTTSYTYDSRGNKLTEKDPNGLERKWSYNSTNDIVSTTDPKGAVTTITRNSFGDPTSIKRTVGVATQESKYVYDEDGDLLKITDPMGRNTSYIYDLGDRGLRFWELRGVSGNEEIVHTWGYNSNGEVTQEVDGRGFESGNEISQFTTKYVISGQGRVTEITDPLGNVTKMGYDGNGNVNSMTDQNGNTTTFVFDAADQRTEVKAANGAISKTSYDSMGHVASRTSPTGNTSEYKYDILGRVTETIDPLGRKTVSEYDLAGNLTKATDPEGRSIVYSYDPGGRGTKVDYSSAGTSDVTYAYDPNGNVTEMTDGSGTTKKTYDVLDRPTEIVNGKAEAVKYEYNLAGDVTKLTYPNGKAITRSYDSIGRLEKIVDWFGAETKFSYYRNSLQKATTFPAVSGNVDEYSYNSRGDVTQIAMKQGLEVAASLNYSWSKAGQLEKVIQKGFPEEPEELVYEYDQVKRLSKGAGTPYEYDSANNPTKIGSALYTYDKGSQIATATTGTYVFNKLGQRVKSTPPSGPATTYAYDQAGNLTSLQRPAEGEFTEINNTYKYDGAGLRVSEFNNGSTYPMVWDGISDLPLLLRKGNDYYIYGPEGLPIEQITSSLTLYFHHDQQGSTRLLTGVTGSVVGTYEYGPYGTLDGHTGTESTQIGYAGQYRAHTNRSIYLRERVYDPSTAQFLSTDPAVQASGEPYSYAADDPVNQTDPTGLTVRGGCVTGSAALPFIQGGGSLCYVGNGRGEWSLIASVSFQAGQNSEAAGFGFDAERNLVSRFESWLKVDGLTSFKNMLKTGAFVGGAWMWSNADSVSQLAEWSFGAGGGAGFGSLLEKVNLTWLGASFDYSQSASDPRIWSKMFAVGYNFGRGIGGSVGGGGSYTVVLWSNNPAVESVYRKVFGSNASIPEPTFREVPCW